VDEHLVLIWSEASRSGLTLADVVNALAPRAARATGVAVLAVPCVLVAHLITTGALVTPGAAALTGLAVLAVAGAVPVRTRAGLGLLAGAAQLVGHTVLAVLPGHDAGRSADCLRVIGRGAELGLRLAIFRHDPGCPTGTVAPGTTLTAALIAVLVAVAIVAGHAAVTGLVMAGAAALTALATLLSALRAAVRAVTVLAAMAGHRSPTVTLPARTGPSRRDHDVRIPRRLTDPTPLRRRGPPPLLAIG
jgi:hypothetical protein